MNNLGMNQIGINPMLNNNMPFGNFQQNLMNMNQIGMQNMILSYENKIKELEGIIRQKDLEIDNLKNMLNINFNNDQNQNFQNFGQMNLMNPKEKAEKNKEICVLFAGYEKILCKKEDMAYKLFDKINPNYNFTLFRFVLNGKKLNPFLTIEENGIKDGDEIDCCRAYNIKFDGPHGFMNIAIDENYHIKKVIKYYLIRIGKEDCFDEYIFTYQSNEINIENKNPIKNLFVNNINPKIKVYKKY